MGEILWCDECGVSIVEKAWKNASPFDGRLLCGDCARKNHPLHSSRKLDPADSERDQRRGEAARRVKEYDARKTGFSVLKDLAAVGSAEGITRLIVGVVLGLLSGILIYFLAVMVIVDPSLVKDIGGGFIFLSFVGGWAMSSYLMIRGAETVSKVFSRGFLIGAAEWLAMIPASTILAGKVVADAANEIAGAEHADAALAGATLGGGISAFFTSGFAVIMALVCMLCFAVSYNLGREMKPEHAMAKKKCPECAELIQAAARKCRYCGSALDR